MIIQHEHQHQHCPILHLHLQHHPPHTAPSHPSTTHHPPPCAFFVTFSFLSDADTFLCIDGFFDAGMLRQALSANRNNEAAVEPAVDREVVRRNVGRRLRLSEY